MWQLIPNIANARFRLYQMLDYLGEKVLYFDTDSVYYIDSISNPIPVPFGSLLGEWTLEREGKVWVSTGLKSYSLKDKCCNVKGFGLNYENSKFINNETMVRMVRSEVNEKVIVEENKITRDSKSKSVINKYLEKKFRFDYNKRVIHQINDGHINTPTFWILIQLSKKCFFFLKVGVKVRIVTVAIMKL
jgi:hypothetical protein